MGTSTEERGRSDREKSRSRERDKSRKDKKHDRKEKDRKDKDRSPSRKHKDRSPSRRDKDRRRSKSRSRDRSDRDRKRRERSRSRSAGRKRRRDEAKPAPPPPDPANIALDIAARISSRALQQSSEDGKATEPQGSQTAAAAVVSSVASTTPATTTATSTTATSTVTATAPVGVFAPAEPTTTAPTVSMNDPFQVEMEFKRRAERAKQFQQLRRQQTQGAFSMPTRPPQSVSRAWSLEDEKDDEDVASSAMADATAVAAAIGRALASETPASQQDKGTPGYTDRMDVPSTNEDVDPLDAFMSSLAQEGPVVPSSSAYGALGAGDESMATNGKKFDPVGSMVITAADLIGGKSNKAGWESDTDVEEGDDMEDSEDEEAMERERQRFMEEFRSKSKRQEQPSSEQGAAGASSDKPTEGAMDVDEKESGTVASGGDKKAGAGSDMGRIFGGEGDVMDEDERVEQEKSALELLQEQIKKKELKPVDHDKIDYLPFKKKLYIVPRALHQLTPEEVNKKREELEIKVRGKGCPAPIDSWSQSGLNDRTLKLLDKLEMREPFPIQKQALPAIMAGRDIIGVAKTGSGKTLAFLLPLFRHILVQEGENPLREGEGPIGLIMAPARELVYQICREAKKFAKPLGLRVSAVYGGAGVADQIGELKRGAHIVVCTPGRMIDILTMQAGKVVSLQRVTYVVMDEADRMFDMGFEPQIRMIIQNVRPDRQTVLFSATFPKQVEGLARRVLKYPLEIIIGGRSVASESITQYVEIHDEEDKMLRLLQLLGVWYEKGNVLIFVDTQAKCDNLFAELLRTGYPCLSLHGGMEQMDRDSTIQDFKKKIKTLMVATSVAGRGLDVPELVCVINYNCPNHLEDYVHRVGRTGRAGRKGTAYTFLETGEEQFAPFMVKALEASKQEVPDELRVMAEAYNKKLSTGEAKKISSGYGGSGFKFDDTEKTEAQKADAAAKRQFEIEAGYTIEDGGDGSDEEEGPAPSAAQEPSTPFPGIVLPPTLPVAPPAAPVAPPPAPPAEPPPNIHPDIAAALKQIQGAGIAPAPPQAPASAAEKMRQLQALFGTPGGGTAGAGGGTLGGGGAARAGAPLSVEEAKRKAAEFAARLAGGTAQPKKEEKVHFTDELEINDYPQQARWKVTHRETMNAVNDLTGCAVISRGQYFPSGKEPEPGGVARKLYLYIEGDSEVAVGAARKELLRILNDETARVGNRASSSGFGGGKYTVI